MSMIESCSIRFTKSLAQNNSFVFIRFFRAWNFGIVEAFIGEDSWLTGPDIFGGSRQRISGRVVPRTDVTRSATRALCDHRSICWWKRISLGTVVVHLKLSKLSTFVIKLGQGKWLVRALRLFYRYKYWSKERATKLIKSLGSGNILGNAVSNCFIVSGLRQTLWDNRRALLLLQNKVGKEAEKSRFSLCVCVGMTFPSCV